MLITLTIAIFLLSSLALLKATHVESMLLELVNEHEMKRAIMGITRYEKRVLISEAELRKKMDAQFAGGYFARDTDLLMKELFK